MTTFVTEAVYLNNGFGIEEYNHKDYDLFINWDKQMVIATPFNPSAGTTRRYFLPMSNIVQITEMQVKEAPIA